MGLTKKNTTKSKSARLTQRLSERKKTSNTISKKSASKTSFPEKLERANELLAGAKLK